MSSTPKPSITPVHAHHHHHDVGGTAHSPHATEGHEFKALGFAIITFSDTRAEESDSSGKVWVPLLLDSGTHAHPPGPIDHQGYP